METKNTHDVASTEKMIQLIKGEFTPSQAAELISSLLDHKINHHKIEGLKLWESNHNSNQEPISNRIKELENERKTAQEFISGISGNGKNLKINGFIKISVIG